MRAAAPAPAHGMLHWIRVLLDGVFPAQCAGCDGWLPVGTASGLCATCRAAIPPPAPPLCSTCGVPWTPPPGADACCPACLHHPPAFAVARAAALYLPAGVGLNPLRTAVWRLKYG